MTDRSLLTFVDLVLDTNPSEYYPPPRSLRTGDVIRIGDGADSRHARVLSVEGQTLTVS
jgi:hypothetical protein